MNQIVPPSLLFDFQLAVPRCNTVVWKKSGSLLRLPKDAQLFLPSLLDKQQQFAEWSAGWNDEGLALQVVVNGKQAAVDGDSSDLSMSDHALIWLDTRPSGNVHRATEYCHHFACLPVDHSNDGQPAVITQPIAQQRVQKIESDPRKMLARTHAMKSGYRFELWIPGTQLYGFREIAEIRRLGFFCVIHDRELGTQHLSLNDEFPYTYDPSLWIPLDLRS